MKIIIVSSLLALLAVPAAAYNNECPSDSEYSYRRALYDEELCGQKVLNMYCDHGEENESYRSLYEKNHGLHGEHTCGYYRRSLYDKEHDDEETYTQCKAPRNSQACKKVATQCAEGRKCLGANMNSYKRESDIGDGANSEEVTKDSCVAKNW